MDLDQIIRDTCKLPFTICSDEDIETLSTCSRGKQTETTIPRVTIELESKNLDSGNSKSPTSEDISEDEITHMNKATGTVHEEPWQLQKRNSKSLQLSHYLKPLSPRSA